MIGWHASRITVFVAAAWVVSSGCDWEELDAIAPLENGGDAQVPDAEVVPDGPATTDAAGGNAEDSRPSSTTDSRVQDVVPAGDGAEAPDVYDALVSDAFESSAACATAATSSIRQWTFDATIEGWTVVDGDSATLAWANGTGWLASGSLQVDGIPIANDAASTQTLIGFNESPAVDLTNRTVSAWLWLDSGTSPSLKLFVQTGSVYTWADGGSIALPLRTWTCVSMSVSSPAYTSQNGNYAPNSVVRIGFELDESAPYRLYVDNVTY